MSTETDKQPETAVRCTSVLAELEAERRAWRDVVRFATMDSGEIEYAIPYLQAIEKRIAEERVHSANHVLGDQ